MALVSKLTIEAVSTLTKTLDLASGTVPLTLKKLFNLADGTGANQADLVFHDTRTLAASATEDLDLSGILTDAYGVAISFVRIRGIFVAAASANTNNVLVGGAASNGFINWVSDVSDKIVVRPNGVFALVAPDATAYVVTGGTGDLLRIGNSGAGTPVSYDIVLIGASV